MTARQWTALATGLAASAMLGVAPALAQGAYPAKPVRMIVPLAAGAALDVFTRAVGKEFEVRTGQPWVVENRAGANTIIAANACKQSDADGYTGCFLTRSTISLNPEVYKKLSYDPLRDFEPITNAFFGRQIVIMNKDVPAKTLTELVAYSKANPDKLNFGSLGLGGDSHLVVEWLKRRTGASIAHVPFKSAPDALHALASGNIQMMALLIGNPGLAPQIRSGGFTGLMVLGNSRVPQVPDVQSLKEAGIEASDTALAPWFGFFAPKGTPKPIVDKLHAEITAIMKSQAFRDMFANNVFSPVGNTPEEFAKFIVEDRKTAAQLVELSGVKINE